MLWEEKAILILYNARLILFYFQLNPLCGLVSHLRGLACLLHLPGWTSGEHYCYSWLVGWRENFDYDCVSVLRRILHKREGVYHGQFQLYLVILAVVDSFLLIFFLIDNVIIDRIAPYQGSWYYVVVPFLSHPFKNISFTMSNGHGHCPCSGWWWWLWRGSWLSPSHSKVKTSCLAMSSSLSSSPPQLIGQSMEFYWGPVIFKNIRGNIVYAKGVLAFS